MLRYLDDMPCLVERYEIYRRSGRAARFDKLTALSETLTEIDGQDLSPRHHKSFAKMMRALLKRRERVSPRFEETFKVAGACFGKHTLKALRAKLLGYFDHIDTRRVGEPITDTTIPVRQATNGEHKRRYVARICNPMARQYAISGASDATPARNKDEWRGWPAWDEHHNRVRDQVFDCAKQQTSRVYIAEWQGSLSQGIDPRATLRARLGPRPRLMVRHLRQERVPIQHDRLEPILWLFESGLRSEVISGYTCAVAEDLKRRWVVAGNAYIKTLLHDNKSTETTVEQRWLMATVSFTQLEAAYDQNAIKLYQSIQERLPLINEWDNALPPGRSEELGHIVRFFFQQALKQAKRGLFFFHPDRYEWPDEFEDQARSAGKEIYPLKLSNLDKEDVTALRKCLWLQLPPSLPEADLITKYGGIVRRFWP